MRTFVLRFLWLSLGLASIAWSAEPGLPSMLEPWRAWVMHGQEFRACPLLARTRANAPGDFICAWPGVLHVDADAAGANIEQRWRVETESWIPLPGSAVNWPQQVSVDGQPAPVVDHEGPALRLAAGDHDVRARIPWQTRPQALRVPETIGLVALDVDGKPVAPLQRAQDQLTLGRGAAAEAEADSLDLRVYRKLADGVPAILTTVIQLSVAGQAREVDIGPVLPDGFVPLALTSETWPARLDAANHLHVQVASPGSETVNLSARATAPLAKVVARVPPPPWPKQEIWSYEAASAERVTAATSPLAVDPRQAAVPDDWAALPAFALGDGAELTVEERSRGLAEDERNRLTLDREMWLDFAGDGGFARDHVGGKMLRGWRFDVAAPFRLERADAMNAYTRNQKGERLLVTRGAEPEVTGVEWRTPEVDLSAGVRVASAAAALPVTGWQDSFDRVTTTLHLPSGYRLLGAPGADSASGSWVSAWTLLDVFIVAIVAFLAWRLFGFVGAAIAVGYLVLGYQESGAPLWTLLAAIALALIARALPPGKLALAAAWLRRAALVLLVLVALPFVAEQLRDALHPQLEGGGASIVASQVAVGTAPPALEQGAATTMQSPAPAPADEAAGAVDRNAAKEKSIETVTVTASNIRRADLVDHYSESTVVQTGIGEPSWTLGSRYELAWNGPVLSTQNVRLLIAPPWIVRVLRIVLVALLAVLIVRLVRGTESPTRNATAFGVFGGVVFASAIMAAGLSVSTPASAQAFPPDNLLGELRTRLVEPPPCVPACATIAQAEIAAHGDEIRVVLEAHVATRFALPIPEDAVAMILRSIRVDGAADEAVARSNGASVIALARGVHRIELVYAASADKIALRFPMLPMHVAFTGDGWQASGIADGRMFTETLALARARESASTPSGNQQFAAYVEVDRDITLGLDWSVSTRVQRLAPKDGGFTVSVPALAGEHVTSAGVKVEAGHVTAAIADNESNTTWSSTLDKSDTITLTAPALADRAEVWHVTASPIWHVESSGVPMGADVPADTGDYRRFDFHPLPGETLTLRITRPQPADGATRAIDRVTLASTAGQRAADVTLDLAMRASQGGEQAIVLPADAEVANVTRNGESLNVRPQNGRLSLPLVPGRQDFQIRLREPTPAAFVTRTPAIALGLPAANIDVALELPADRWLLATTGPTEGPAVLYWSELAAMLLVAWALARTRRTPLKLWQWILLGLGFSTFSWLALLLVAAWLFALDWRARAAPPTSPVVFNLAQIGLAVLTVIAMLCLAGAIPQGLLGTPDMHVVGAGSSANALRWFADRSVDGLPVASAISVPLWVYKLAMLAWAIWLASAVIGWLRYGFAAWMQGGYWRSPPPKAVVEIPASAPPPVGRT